MEPRSLDHHAAAFSSPFLQLESAAGPWQTLYAEPAAEVSGVDAVSLTLNVVAQ